ncbi:MAG: hypothetical protein J7M39_10525 [Anaerolineae bacterium]|nr:hypothetical protein [Anaerolineae bacterium]
MTRSATSLILSVTEGVPSSLPVTLTQGLPEGTLLRLRASGLSMLRGLRVAAVFAHTSTDEVEMEIVHRYSSEELKHDWMWHIRALSIAVCRAPQQLDPGTELRILTEARICPKVADLTWTMYVGVVHALGDVELAQVTDPVQLHFVAGPVDHIEAVLKPDRQVMVEQFDRYGNPARSETKDVLTAAVRDASEQIAVAPGLPATEFAAPSEDVRAPLPVGLRVAVVDRAERSATTNALPVAIDGTPIYFGEFHWHTDFSGDGQRSIAAALASARDELGLDFAGPTDHMSPDGTYLHRLVIEQAEICRRFDVPGRFCTIPGAELSARYGHTNLYAADFDTFLSIVHRFPHELLPVWQEMPDAYPLEVLSALCPEGKAMIVPHHTNMDSSVKAGVVRDDGRPFWCALHWPQATPLLRQGLRLVEIVQNRGAFESEEPDEGWRVHWGRFGGSVQTALMRGHRVGFVGGTDNHTGWPTRLTGKAGYGGLTAIQAEALEGGTLFDALYRRRCYATSGARIVADATLNGYPIGSELRQQPGDPRVFEIRIYGTAPIVAVQIVSMGTVLADLPVTGASLDFAATWADDRPGRPLQDVAYYVRARQADSHCVWLSPWWVDLAAE